MRGLFVNTSYKIWKFFWKGLYKDIFLDLLKQKRMHRIARRVLRKSRPPAGKSLFFKSKPGRKFFQKKSFENYYLFEKVFFDILSLDIAPPKEEEVPVEEQDKRISKRLVGKTYIKEKKFGRIDHQKGDLLFDRYKLLRKFGILRPLKSRRLLQKPNRFLKRRRLLMPYAENYYTTKPNTGWSFLKNFNIKSIFLDEFLGEDKTWAGFQIDFLPLSKIKNIIYLNKKFIFQRQPLNVIRWIETINRILLLPKVAILGRKPEIPVEEIKYYRKHLETGYFFIQPMVHSISLEKGISYTRLIGYYAWRPIYATTILLDLQAVSHNISKLISHLVEHFINIYIGMLEIRALLTPVVDNKTSYLQKVLLFFLNPLFYIFVRRRIAVKINKSQLVKRALVPVKLVLRYLWYGLVWTLKEILKSPIKIPYLILKYIFRFIKHLIWSINTQRLAYVSKKYVYVYLFKIYNKIFIKFYLLKILLNFIIQYIKVKAIIPKIRFRKSSIFINTPRYFNYLKYPLILVVLIGLFVDTFYINFLISSDTTLMTFAIIISLVYLLILLTTTFRREVLNTSGLLLTTVWLVAFYELISVNPKEREFFKVIDFTGIASQRNILETFEVSTTINIYIIILLVLLLSLCIVYSFSEKSLMEFYVDDIYIPKKSHKSEVYPSKIIRDIFMGKQEIKHIRSYQKWLTTVNASFFYEAKTHLRDRAFFRFHIGEEILTRIREEELEEYNDRIWWHKRLTRRELFKRKLAKDLKIRYDKKEIIYSPYKMDIAPFLKKIFEDEDDLISDDVYDEIIGSVLYLNIVHLLSERKYRTLKKKDKNLLDKYRIIFNDWDFPEDENMDEFALTDEEGIEKWSYADPVPNTILDPEISISKIAKIVKRLPEKLNPENADIFLELKLEPIFTNFMPHTGYFIKKELQALKDKLILEEEALILDTFVKYASSQSTAYIKVALPIGDIYENNFKALWVLRSDYYGDEIQKLDKKFHITDNWLILWPMFVKGTITSKNLFSLYGRGDDFIKYTKNVVLRRKYGDYNNFPLHLTDLRGYLKPTILQRLRFYKKLYKKLTEK